MSLNQITDAAALLAIHSSYRSYGEAQTDHETGFVLDVGQLPDGREVSVYYDLPEDHSGNWGVEFVAMAVID